MSNLKQSANQLKNQLDRVSLVISRDSVGVPVNVAASIIPQSCSINDYIEAIETLKAFGLSDSYGNSLIAEAEDKLWGEM